MSDEKKPERGTVGWLDLTVENAGEIRDFYREVVGWKSDTVDMGDEGRRALETLFGRAVERGILDKVPPLDIIQV